MHNTVPTVIGLLVAATVLAIGAKRAQLPYNVALVVGGMLIALGHLLPNAPPLSADAVFLLCLPALIFEGGITADLAGIRANLSPIALLSTGGMGVAIGATGTAVHFILRIPWGASFLLGTVLAVTDTVSVLYAFRRARVPKRLASIMEGESLFNDGTALVAYGAISSIVTGRSEFHATAIAARVIFATAGGFAVGLAIGLAAAWVLRRTEDPLTEIMATTALAFASYTVAEQIHVSGVIAAVTAGLAIGTALRTHIAPQSRVAISSFWEYAAFGVNTFLFLSVGLATRPDSLFSHLGETFAAVACVFAGRAVAVYGPLALLGWLRPSERVPMRWQHVFVLGNIKGALSIALALGLPAAMPGRQLLVDVAFGVTFVSLVVQGLMLGRSIRWLGLEENDPVDDELAQRQGRLIAARAARIELDALYAAGQLPRAGYEQLRSEYQVIIAGAERELRGLHERHLAQGARSLLATRRRLLDVERTAVAGARRAGLIPEHAAEELLAKADERLLKIEHALGGHGAGHEGDGNGHAAPKEQRGLGAFHAQIEREARRGQKRDGSEGGA